MSGRHVIEIVTAHQQRQADGLSVRRAFPGSGVEMVDPVLALDEIGPIACGDDKHVGDAERPFRGFELVTYLLEGELSVRDSTGNVATLHAGDLQWLSAGSGVLHRHGPSTALRDAKARLHGFELWVNLRSTDKAMQPRRQFLAADQVRETSTVDGRATCRILCGEALGIDSPIETRTPLGLHHWTVQPSAEIEVVLPRGHNAFVYVFDGSLQVADRVVECGQIAVLGLRGDHVRLAVATDATAPSQALVVAGEPLQEPVAWGDTFVMSTREEVLAAIEDFQAGRFGALD